LALEERFGIPQREPRGDPLDGLIRTILSQNTNDKNRDRAFESLKEAFPSWHHALAAGQRAIEASIRSAGISRIKSRRIVSILESLRESPQGLSLYWLRGMSREEVEDFLLSFKGVGKKTARCVMLFELGHSVFPVDTHILRVAKRLGWVNSSCPADRASDILEEFVPSDGALSLHLNLIRLGREICRPRRPSCPSCPLLAICQTGGSHGTDARAG
jgi:endonuclease-3